MSVALVVGLLLLYMWGLGGWGACVSGTVKWIALMVLYDDREGSLLTLRFAGMQFCQTTEWACHVPSHCFLLSC